MFNFQSITACNTRRLALVTLDPMHKSATRLYEAARKIGRIEGQSAVARLLNLSPQVLKNWETRGVSFEGAVIAERILGVSPAWLLDETGDTPLMTSSRLVAHDDSGHSLAAAFSSVQLDKALPVVLTALARMNALQLAAVTAVLEKLRGHPEWIADAIDELLPKLEAAQSNSPGALVANGH